MLRLREMGLPVRIISRVRSVDGPSGGVVGSGAIRAEPGLLGETEEEGGEIWREKLRGGGGRGRDVVKGGELRVGKGRIERYQ